MEAKTVKCPNCGAVVNTGSGSVCEYCGSEIELDTDIEQVKADAAAVVNDRYIREYEQRYAKWKKRRWVVIALVAVPFAVAFATVNVATTFGGICAMLGIALFIFAPMMYVMTEPDGSKLSSAIPPPNRLKTVLVTYGLSLLISAAAVFMVALFAVTVFNQGGEGQ